MRTVSLPSSPGSLGSQSSRHSREPAGSPGAELRPGEPARPLEDLASGAGGGSSPTQPPRGASEACPSSCTPRCPQTLQPCVLPPVNVDGLRLLFRKFPRTCLRGNAAFQSHLLRTHSLLLPIKYKLQILPQTNIMAVDRTWRRSRNCIHPRPGHRLCGSPGMGPMTCDFQ